MRSAIFGVLAAIVLSSSAMAATYTTIDISKYVNANVSINPQTFPTGTSLGNKRTGVPVNIAKFNKIAGAWISNGRRGNQLSVDLHSLNIPGTATLYGLLNNWFGTPHKNEYTITITATGNKIVTFNSIGCKDTRDYNELFCNTIRKPTVPWFGNRYGQRLDLRPFVLPPDFAGQTLTSFIIKQMSSGENAVFSGLTYGMP
jgi:hypothetical protein